MKIKVEVINDILGNSIFWQGDSENINDIGNIPAMLTAEKVVADGVDRKCGMWHVSVMKE